jgi:hypothetical protein
MAVAVEVAVVGLVSWVRMVVGSVGTGGAGLVFGASGMLCVVTPGPLGLGLGLALWKEGDERQHSRIRGLLSAAQPLS